MIEVFIGDGPVIALGLVPIVLAALALGLATSTAQFGMTIAGGIGAKKRADKANRLRKRLLERTHAEEKLQFEKQVGAILGRQRALYSAYGVEVEGGTPAFLQKETEDAETGRVAI